ncbi:hypothetical protein SERLA73DRAFT_189012 [Serpula lacrymans var. lacrymans S7.3]|uniref:Uncharacterized protein n=2 Tax=Serpula lacrymans var. lacrymans TaxID=341189 RepID=F8QCM9_SERL3|nr:uncharacterized protein SERLADRAFT_479643 [Serpula lacrymans var. lacrymans S7.9]EGN93894.1 hypothetical protein SERLA73DRAFT_189012 [Serpula lacrymans var. lacrymans S7.3]EGO19261.1 hypothetical protein SERLADRAFT_479643 [Serpula lacrymans var. lacrymans S7.9]
MQFVAQPLALDCLNSSNDSLISSHTVTLTSPSPNFIMATTVSTILYPQVTDRDWGSRNGLRPLNTTISFKGSVPATRIRLADVPLKVSITLPQECAGITPVVNFGPLDFMYCGRSLPSVLCSHQEEMQELKIPLSFLPLHPSFNPYNTQSWVRLMNSLQCWLLTEVVNRQSLEWVWGCKAFWMAYVAAYPKFPYGQWTRWSPKISPEGCFLQDWLAKRDAVVLGEDTLVFGDDADYISARCAIWGRLQELISLVYNGSIVTTST